MQDAYEDERDRARRVYRSVRYVHSPALNERVYFTAEGFSHLMFKTLSSERERRSQVARFKLLSRAIKLVGLSTTYQEYERVSKKLEVMSYKKVVRKAMVIKYWGIIAIVGGKKIKVIIRKKGHNADAHFWSVVPGWKTSGRRDVRFTMKGNPEED